MAVCLFIYGNMATIVFRFGRVARSGAFTPSAG
jgi:hypothetical protein